MRSSRRISYLLLILVEPVFLAAVHAQEGRRPFCSASDCVPDTLEIVFRPQNSSTLVLDEFTPNARVGVQVVTETKTELVRGWSFAVKHDEGVLSILEDDVNTDGTVADPSSPDTVVVQPAFEAVQLVPGGFTVGVVLSFVDSTAALPTGRRNPITNAAYSVIADPGETGTRIALSSEEIPESRPVSIKFTVGAQSQSKAPEFLVDGILKTPPPSGGETCRKWALYFGPQASEETWDATGADFVPITMRNDRSVVALQLGIRLQAREEAGYELSFTSELGAGEDRAIELILTDHEYVSWTPRTSNAAITRIPPARVRRGAATEAFAGSDYLFVNLAPSPPGARGIIVAYVADEQARPERCIPATVPEGSPCGVNEILLLELEEPAAESLYLLGNVNGDQEVNLTDAVFGLNHLFTGGQEPPCVAAADADSDGDINLTDMVFLLNHLYLGGPAPAYPYPECATAPISECSTSHAVCESSADEAGR